MTVRSDHGFEVSDEALLAGICVGDQQSILIFVRRYQRRLYGLALGILGDPHLAEDAAQESFIRIFKHAAAFDTRRGAVSSWALTIARNVAIDSLRTRRSVPVAPEDRLFMNLVSADREPDDAVVSSESVRRARHALSVLPIEQRRAVVLASIHGRTAAEIAEEESIPLGTAKSRIRLGMARLRETVSIKEAT